MAIETATHEAPVWRDRANFLVLAELSESGLEGRSEQLWVTRVGDDEFILCCIPYFTYGMSLGDRLKTHASGEKQYVVSTMLVPSGRRVLRLWLKGATAEARKRVEAYLSRSKALHEWSSDDLLAVDVPDELAREEALLMLDEEASIESEWGD